MFFPLFFLLCFVHRCRRECHGEGVCGVVAEAAERVAVSVFVSVSVSVAVAVSVSVHR